MEVVNGIYSPLTANIVNCSFSNCWGTAVSGIGNGGNNFPGWIAATIENCSFSSIGIGCSFYLSGVNYYGAYNGYGMGNVQLLDNLFNNITDTAISLTQNGIALNSPATVINNIIFNASNAIISQDPWDATVMDNIFMGCTNVVTDNGSLSRNIEFNDFYKNATNFIGYSSDYGTVIIDNRNSTPCDLLFNLYQNPLFVTTNNFKFTLQTNSPCIDAGTPNIAYMDTSFPPSQGTSFPDLGIYGGPLAANWLPVIQSSGASFGVLTNTFGFAISAPFSMSIVVQVQACTNLASGAWSALQSCTLTNGSSQFSDPAWTNYPGRFYRISYPYP